MKTKLLISALIVACLMGVQQVFAQDAPDDFYVRITNLTEEKTFLLKEMGFVVERHDYLDEALIVANKEQLNELSLLGIEYEIVQAFNTNGIDPEYHTYEEMLFFLDSIASAYPEITKLDTMGTSQFEERYIPMIKISDNPELEEDEAAILYDGMHHAREPLGMETCLKLIGYLVSNYDSDPDVKNWIDNIEFFIIPVLNPDGWNYVVESADTYPYWRKNLRDNDGDQIFDPSIDGVDPTSC